MTTRTDGMAVDDVTLGPDWAEIAHAVFEAGLEAAREIEDDPFPEWRVRSLRDAQDAIEPAVCHAREPEALVPEHVGMMLDVCHYLAPTPHERMEYEADVGGDHPFFPMGEAPVALRPFIGEALPEAPRRDG